MSNKIKRFFEIIIFGFCFWLIHFYVINYKDKLIPYDPKLKGIAGVGADFNNPGIIQMQNFDTTIFSIMLAVFIFGYYTNVLAEMEYSKRLNNTATIDIRASNRKIIGLRIVFLMCLYISVGPTIMILANLPDAETVKFFIVPVIPVSLGLGLYFVFRKISTIFSFQLTMSITVVLLAIVYVSGYFHLGTAAGRGIGTLLTSVLSTTKKWKEIDQFFKENVNKE
ncbi:hypothetical protein [Flavobacterium chilense]|uniref:Uncharacterized protein n=1 Tax=Flavobacterium chilense TaxID=946677 RepID=A0A1M7F4Q7_9FLAO|nr:hypothetical protein [Flavobacterium chilense]SHL99051.1 hypothetical protein SAMN05444484_103225 [Flavobacterium chilense]